MKLVYILGSLCLLSACEPQAKQAAIESADKSDWMDTVRFNSQLTSTQRGQVFNKRNFEEDYQAITDTARVAMRFYWWRAFHPHMVVRVENRPEIEIDTASGKRNVYEEWFALHKNDVQRLNHDCPVRRVYKRGYECYGKPAPYVWQQHVELLPVGKQPAIVAMLDSMHFWQMPAVAPAEPQTDGSHWILQVYAHGKYHEVSTDLADHPIKKICLRMLTMSGYKPTKDEIY